MKMLIQRVTCASVEVKSKVVGSIGPGVLIFVGISSTDTFSEVDWLANKLVHLRMFADEKGKMNRSLLEEKKEVLIVSQFTLYADCSFGRRPSFTQAAPPQVAEPLYERFIDEVKKFNLVVATGIFGAEMQISLVNDGPVTFLLEKESL